MKHVLMLALSLTSSMAFAGEKFICQQTDGDRYSPKKMILTQIGTAEIREGKPYSFKLEVFEGRGSEAKISETVTVETEDVMFGFKNKVKKISGMIYLDELDQTWLKVG